VLRTAQTLAAAKVPQRRITRSVKQVAPALAGANAVVGSEHLRRRGPGRGARRRQSLASGQRPIPAGLRGRSGQRQIERDRTQAGRRLQPRGGFFERALALESDDAPAAMALYQQAITADPQHLDARINLGLLLHEDGRSADAEEVYRAALADCGSDPIVLFNLGVLLEELGRQSEAAVSYEAALRLDPAWPTATTTSTALRAIRQTERCNPSHVAVPATDIEVG